MSGEKIPQLVSNANAIETEHPQYQQVKPSWAKIRDCMEGEDAIKAKKETYLPRPGGMAGEFASAYDAYIERAHFPLITSYALSGALGIIITKLPEFNLPKQLTYLLKEATKDGQSLQQLFLDIVIEIFQTGRVPLLVDIVSEKNEFRFVQYKAEDLINWKSTAQGSEQNLILGVLVETVPATGDIFSHDTEKVYRVLSLDLASGKYTSQMFSNRSEYEEFKKQPNFMGRSIKEIPLVMAGSLNNSFDMQPRPLIAVANCSVQIYRKEADLANSEFLSCNPTLVITGATNDDDLPNVVGSSVMIVVPDAQARVYYTKTDTAALKTVKDHVTDMYDEAIRHGVAILDARKGVEAAEALRIRQSTQSASIYSVYLSALNAIKQGLVVMCKWGGYNEKDIIIDAPEALTQGIPDSSVLKEVIAGFGQGVIPSSVVHRYLVASGLIDQTVGYADYLKLVKEEAIKIKEKDEGEVKTKTTATKKTKSKVDEN